MSAGPLRIAGHDRRLTETYPRNGCDTHGVLCSAAGQLLAQRRLPHLNIKITTDRPTAALGTSKRTCSIKASDRS